MKKTKTMYGKFAALILSAVLLAGCVTVTAQEPEVNLLEGYNPGFELSEGNTISGAVIIDAVAHSGKHALTLPVAGNSVTMNVRNVLKPNTNYTFSFWMQNSVADSLSMSSSSNRFTIGNQTFANYNGKKPHEAFPWYVAGMGQLPNMTFGDARTGEQINVWRKVELNFTTPFEGCDGMNINLANAVADPYLVIDDLSLVETGKDLQRAYNGDLEALDASGDISIPQFIGARANVWGTNVHVREDAQTGNHYAEFTETLSNGALELTQSSFVVTGKGNYGKRRKISFDFKSTAKAIPTVRFYNDPTYLAKNFTAFPRSVANEWETFSLYIDATKLYKAGADEGRAATIWFTGKEGYCFDNLFSGFDENSLGFYQKLVFYDNGSGSRFSGSGTYYENALSSEKSIKAAKLSDIPADKQGNRTVTTRAHVVPTEIMNENGVGTGTFNKETVTLFTGVYKYENNKKTLVDLHIATDASQDGRVLDAVGTITVPQNTETATYKVEALAFDLENGMHPIMEKAILE